ncbi:MAG: nitrous oxide reductase accessory protein NosL [Colwellia sp.]|nr:nitrous oxide reductase accessory protein NosL [Colwellia sp.]
MKYFINIFIVVLAIFLLQACTPQQENKITLQQAVNIERADECHLCGMLISHFAGPKGELYRKEVTKEGSNSVKKFCSTRDMFSFYLDPENKRNVTTMLVHDMSKSPWDSPNDQYFIDAEKAWFVAGSNQTGAMGKTLASFSNKQDAEAFIKEFDGKLLTFAQIDLSILME